MNLREAFRLSIEANRAFMLANRVPTEPNLADAKAKAYHALEALAELFLVEEGEKTAAVEPTRPLSGLLRAPAASADAYRAVDRALEGSGREFRPLDVSRPPRETPSNG